MMHLQKFVTVTIQRCAVAISSITCLKHQKNINHASFLSTSASLLKRTISQPYLGTLPKEKETKMFFIHFLFSILTIMSAQQVNKSLHPESI